MCITFFVDHTKEVHSQPIHFIKTRRIVSIFGKILQLSYLAISDIHKSQKTVNQNCPRLRGGVLSKRMNQQQEQQNGPSNSNAAEEEEEKDNRSIIINQDNKEEVEEGDNTEQDEVETPVQPEAMPGPGPSTRKKNNPKDNLRASRKYLKSHSAASNCRRVRRCSEPRRLSSPVGWLVGKKGGLHAELCVEMCDLVSRGDTAPGLLPILPVLPGPSTSAPRFLRSGVTKEKERIAFSSRGKRGPYNCQAEDLAFIARKFFKDELKNYPVPVQHSFEEGVITRSKSKLAAKEMQELLIKERKMIIASNLKFRLRTYEENFGDQLKQHNQFMTSIRKQKAESRKKLKITRGEIFEGDLEPIKLLPEEVWEVILDKVSTIDRLHVCRANSQWDLMFGESKCQWLLDQVLPFIFIYFTSRSDILRCRLVCKRWKKAIDDFLGTEHPFRRAFDKDHVIDTVQAKRSSVYTSLRRCQLEYTQFTPHRVEKFLSCPYLESKQQTCPTPIIIGKAVSFIINGLWEPSSVINFLTAAKTFLGSYGRLVWHFRVVQYNLHFDPLRFYEELCGWLQQLPNLRTLTVNCQLDKLYNNDEERELRTLMENQPLPHLEHLLSIVTDGMSKSIQPHLIKHYGPQLDKLVLDMNVHVDTQQYFPPNLKELFAKRLSNDEVFSKLWTANISKNISKLTLDFSMSNCVRGPELVTLLRQFPKLVHLRIVLSTRTKYLPLWTYNLLHPQNLVLSVENFEIEGDSRDIFNFTTLLFAFPCLKYLHLRAINNRDNHSVRQEPPRDDAKVEIEHFLYTKSMNKSPIWTTLSELEVFTFENGAWEIFCNREMALKWQEECENSEKSKEVASMES